MPVLFSSLYTRNYGKLFTHIIYILPNNPVRSQILWEESIDAYKYQQCVTYHSARVKIWNPCPRGTYILIELLILFYYEELKLRGTDGPTHASKLCNWYSYGVLPLLHLATLTNVHYILLGNMLAQISIKGQKVNISGITGHTVHHSCPTLPLEQENSHRQYGNEYIGCVFIKLFWWLEGHTSFMHVLDDSSDSKVCDFSVNTTISSNYICKILNSFYFTVFLFLPTSAIRSVFTSNSFFMSITTLNRWLLRSIAQYSKSLGQKFILQRKPIILMTELNKVCIKKELKEIIVQHLCKWHMS